MAGEVSFIEFGVGDTEKGREFYEGLFGWTFEAGPSGNGFAIETPNVPGGMHGGDEGGAACVFYAVDDIEASIARVRELGGQIVELDIEGDEGSVERFGRFKMCTDHQGSTFGLHQPPA